MGRHVTDSLTGYFRARRRFLRISRSVIVNMDQIQELQPMFKGENLIVLKNGKSYPTTRPIREIQQKLEFR